MNKRLWVYRKLNDAVVRPFVLPRFFSPERIQSSRNFIELVQTQLQSQPLEGVWFHASSVGELEILWPILARTHQKFGVSVFSESAGPQLERLKKEFSSKLCFAEYAPFEGHWKEALQAVSPQVFVTAKYEAWPELWTSLSELKIPLVIVGARPRKSLKNAEKVCRLLGVSPPQITMLASTSEDFQAIEEAFPPSTHPTIKAEVTGDPRWDRVFERTQRKNTRLASLLSRLSTDNPRPRPWGVLGSVWLSDLEFFGQESLKKLSGTLWVVPHHLGSKELESIEAFLRKSLRRVIRSTTLREQVSDPSQSDSQLHDVDTIMVDEMGFLSELYEHADWAYVGGGFGKGVHSTIEPALHGIPIACGKKNTAQFPEIHQLQDQGQLSVLEAQVDWEAWLSEHQSPSGQNKERWKEQNQKRLGASQRVENVIRGLSESLTSRDHSPTRDNHQ